MPGLIPAALLLAGEANATASDDLATAQLPRISETIVITARRDDGAGLSFESRHFLPDDGSRIAYGDLTGLIDGLPSVHLPTNSRGESLAVLRNAAERQVAIFYDGAAINVPWDNRLDLNLVPTGLVCSVRSATGPLAPHYGVNVLGAISLSPRDAGGGGGGAAAILGQAGAREMSAWFALPLTGTGDMILGGSHAVQDGQPLSAEADLPFSQSDTDLRTNTDRRLTAGFARLSADTGSSRFSFSAFHVSARKGIAPEGDRPLGARFWRYPDIRHTVTVVSLTGPLGRNTELSSVFWYQHFGQTIDAFTDDSYDRIEAREIDRDDSFGLRELLTHEAGRIRLVGSFTFLDSRHRQRDIMFQDGMRPSLLPPRLNYRQRNWSLGGEVEYQVSTNVVAEIGLGYDQVHYVETGDKPPVRDQGGWNGRAGFIWSGANAFLLRAAIGRKIRTPTMRELFGQALNRFLINPGLQPERIITAEIGAEWRHERGRFYITPFYQHVDGTIDQRTIGGLRQRINLIGSNIAGVELGGEFTPGPGWRVSGNVTWAPARRRGAPAGESDRLGERPDLLARASLTHMPAGPVMFTIDAEHIGRALSADASGRLVPVKRSTRLDLQARYRLSDSGLSELFLDVENLTDTLIEPQLGLPAPGRWIRFGFRVGW
jgi:iron complex outermembrane receptor protein